jgi:hypothetical protein
MNILIIENEKPAADKLLKETSSRLQLTLKDKEKSDLFVVSRDKVSEFKRWIDR